MIQHVRAFVLRTQQLSEHDCRATLFTRELGKLKANVIGVKKSVSKLRPLTLPFVECRVQLFLHGGKRSHLQDPGKVIGGEILQDLGDLRGHWKLTLEAAFLCELLDVLTPYLAASAKEYDWLKEHLILLSQKRDPRLVRLRFTLGLLKILGYSLRHHALWQSFDAAQKDLIDRLARFEESLAFSDEQLAWLENAVQRYLVKYLPYELKSEKCIAKVERYLRQTRVKKLAAA